MKTQVTMNLQAAVHRRIGQQIFAVDFDHLISQPRQDLWRELGDFLGVANLDAQSIPTSNAAFESRVPAISRFLFDRSSFGRMRQALHLIVPSPKLRGHIAARVYDRNRRAPTAPVDRSEEQAERAIVARHIGFDAADLAPLLGAVDWPTLLEIEPGEPNPTNDEL